MNEIRVFNNITKELKTLLIGKKYFQDGGKALGSNDKVARPRDPAIDDIIKRVIKKHNCPNYAYEFAIANDNNNCRRMIYVYNYHEIIVNEEGIITHICRDT